MTKRDVFQTVKAHLLRQNARATSGGSCSYRATDGTKCAVGCLIPDEVYTPRMEGKGVGPLLSEYSDLSRSYGEHVELLQTLQRIHDGYDPVKWADMLEGVRLSLFA